MLKTECEHYEAAGDAVAPKSAACEECGLERPLRVCVSCGHVGCCESANKHDTLHWQQTGHAIIRKLPLSDDSFTWCYEHHAYLE